MFRSMEFSTSCRTVSSEPRLFVIYFGVFHKTNLIVTEQAEKLRVSLIRIMEVLRIPAPIRVSKRIGNKRNLQEKEKYLETGR